MKTMLLALLVCSATLTSAYGQNLESEAYNVGYGHVLDANWREARVHLRGFLEQYPRSSRADAANFWLCYSGEKLERDPATTFNCYREFAEQWPTSNWTDDARVSMTRAAEQLAAQGRSEYMDILQTMKQQDDLEVRLSALEALVRQNDADAVQQVRDIYQKAEEQHLRIQVIETLGRAQSPRAFEALALLVQLAEDGEERHLMARLLARSKDGHGIVPLENLYRQNPGDEELQYRLLEAYYATRSPDKLDEVAAIAQRSQHERVVQGAIAVIQRMTDAGHGEQAIPVLEELARKSPESEHLAFGLIRTYHSDKSARGTQRIMDFVLTVPNTRVKAETVQLLGSRMVEFVEHGERQQAAATRQQNIQQDPNYRGIRRLLDENQSEQVQRAGLQAFARIYRSHGLEPMIQFAATHPDSGIRDEAIAMLLSLEKDEWAPAAEAVAERNGTKAYRFLAQAYMQHGWEPSLKRVVEIATAHADVNVRMAVMDEVKLFVEAEREDTDRLQELVTERMRQLLQNPGTYFNDMLESDAVKVMALQSQVQGRSDEQAIATLKAALERVENSLVVRKAAYQMLSAYETQEAKSLIKKYESELGER